VEERSLVKSRWKGHGSLNLIQFPSSSAGRIFKSMELLPEIPSYQLESCHIKFRSGQGAMRTDLDMRSLCLYENETGRSFCLQVERFAAFRALDFLQLGNGETGGAF